MCGVMAYWNVHLSHDLGRLHTSSHKREAAVLRDAESAVGREPNRVSPAQDLLT